MASYVQLRKCAASFGGFTKHSRNYKETAWMGEKIALGWPVIKLVNLHCHVYPIDKLMAAAETAGWMRLDGRIAMAYKYPTSIQVSRRSAGLRRTASFWKDKISTIN